MSWEYKVIKVEPINDRLCAEDGEEVAGDGLVRLNELGKEGWEVVAEVVFADFDDEQLVKYTLKRKTER